MLLGRSPGRELQVYSSAEQRVLINLVDSAIRFVGGPAGPPARLVVDAVRAHLNEELDWSVAELGTSAVVVAPLSSASVTSLERERSASERWATQRETLGVRRATYVQAIWFAAASCGRIPKQCTDLSFEVAAVMSAVFFTGAMWAFKAVGSRATRTQCSRPRAATRSEQHHRYRCQGPNCLRRRPCHAKEVMEHRHYPCPGEWLISLDGHTLLDGSARPGLTAELRGCDRKRFSSAALNKKKKKGEKDPFTRGGRAGLHCKIVVMNGSQRCEMHNLALFRWVGWAWSACRVAVAILVKSDSARNF